MRNYFDRFIDESSYQFGMDWCEKWIKGRPHFLCVLMASSLTRNKIIFKDLYRLIGEKIEPIEAYEETFTEQEDGGILYREDFAKGFSHKARRFLEEVGIIIS